VRELIPVTIVRDIIRVKSVRFRALEDGYGYIRLTQFQEDTSEEFHNAIKELTKKEPLSIWMNADESGVRKRLENQSLENLKKIIGNNKIIVIDEIQRIKNDLFKDFASGSDIVDFMIEY
jgi:hypothetical protein